jgi:succinate-acetate transporter protein
LATLRVNSTLVLAFSLLDLTFLFLTIAEFSKNLTILRIGGGTGLATAAVAFYVIAAQLVTEEYSLFALPVGSVRRLD